MVNQNFSNTCKLHIGITSIDGSFGLLPRLSLRVMLAALRIASFFTIRNAICAQKLLQVAFGQTKAIFCLWKFLKAFMSISCSSRMFFSRKGILTWLLKTALPRYDTISNRTFGTSPRNKAELPAVLNFEHWKIAKSSNLWICNSSLAPVC